MSARFVMSAQGLDGLPQLGMLEVACVGRSNVGKSSLLGALLREPKLVRTSKTPGRTQSLNVFVLDERVMFVDLPGYGFAKVSKAQLQRLDEMVGDYITMRSTVAAMLLILDARRESPHDGDCEVVREARAHGRRLVIVLNKCDLISKTHRARQWGLIAGGLALPSDAEHWWCSTKTGEGVGPLRSIVLALGASSTW